MPGDEDKFNTGRASTPARGSSGKAWRVRGCVCRRLSATAQVDQSPLPASPKHRRATTPRCPRHRPGTSAGTGQTTAAGQLCPEQACGHTGQRGWVPPGICDLTKGETPTRTAPCTHAVPRGFCLLRNGAWGHGGTSRSSLPPGHLPGLQRPPPCLDSSTAPCTQQAVKSRGASAQAPKAKHLPHTKPRPRRPVPGPAPPPPCTPHRKSSPRALPHPHSTLSCLCLLPACPGLLQHLLGTQGPRCTTPRPHMATLPMSVPGHLQHCPAQPLAPSGHTGSVCLISEFQKSRQDSPRPHSRGQQGAPTPPLVAVTFVGTPRARRGEGRWGGDCPSSLDFWSRPRRRKQRPAREEGHSPCS